ncbi:FAD-binding oxidoreductase, partial [Chloroflexota bacterium]
KKHHELYKELGSIVGTKYVSDSLAVLLAYTRDMSSFPAEKPQGVVVRPGSVEEVVELVRLANQTRTPLVPIGGKSTYAGVPPGQPGRGIVVDMRRMKKVLEIDEANRAVTVQCGITLGEMKSKVNERGWDVNTAFMPHYADTVGGQLSGYVGGGWGVYGPSIGFNGMHYLLGLKVVLPNGSVIDTGSGEGGISTYRGHSWARNMHGPDFGGMFLTDGGIFGLKVEATYRMFRPPKFQKTGARYWYDLDEAFAALHELWEIDPYLYTQPYARFNLTGAEMFSQFPGGNDLYVPGKWEPWFLYWLNIGNSEEEIELKCKTIDAVLDKHGGKVADPALASLVETFYAPQAFLWELGKWASVGLFALYELVVSQRDLKEALKWTCEFMDNLRGEMAEKGIDTSKIPFIACAMPAAPEAVGILACGTHFDQNDKDVHRAIHEGLLEFLEQASRRGYVFDATHGYGSKVRAKFWTPEYHNYVLTMKKVLDPNNIMNPGVYSL